MMKSPITFKTLGVAIVAGSTLAMVAAFPASALSGVAQGDNLGTGLAGIITTLEGMDYTIEEIEKEEGMIEIYVTTSEGDFEIEIDAETGLVAEVEAEDEDDDNDADEEEDADNETDNG
ncbi:MAG: hypothetical protein AAFR71_10205 [Pseudomonadota bacterium]